MRFLLDRLFGNMVFWLLFSSFLHVLVMVYPIIGKIGSKGSETPSYRLPLIAPMKPSTLFVVQRTTKTSPSMAAPKLKVPKPLVDLQFEEVIPKSNFAELLDLIPSGVLSYYEVSELTVKPVMLDEPIFELEEFSDSTVSGRLILGLQINAQGTVNDASVDFSDLPESFSQTAIRAFRTLHFVPGELNGEKVDSMLRIEIRYGEAEGAP